MQVVICNLYPFEKTVAKADVTWESAIENIDIGGVALLRAAAKNHSRVVVITDPVDYNILLEKIKSPEGIDEQKRYQNYVKFRIK